VECFPASLYPAAGMGPIPYMVRHMQPEATLGVRKAQRATVVAIRKAQAPAGASRKGLDVSYGTQA
jgi:hypothetical protein